ncbi:Anaerobic C4-dicarboxylate transporter DcuA [Serratia fonticola]|uniref:C4-dicarboxylate transporter DcuA n=1 Tax=Serratia fonticola TaxID=47917 RepID=A0A4U9VUQ9_SERFO|nr:Anaerobic C4-dicarboxylate transporter DcuA [Serratia fonticola]
MVVIPSTFLAVILMSLLVTWLFDSKLSDDPVYQKRFEEGLVALRGENVIVIKPRAKTSVLLFLAGVLSVVAYASSTAQAWVCDDAADEHHQCHLDHHAERGHPDHHPVSHRNRPDFELQHL